MKTVKIFLIFSFIIASCAGLSDNECNKNFSLKLYNLAVHSLKKKNNQEANNYLRILIKKCNYIPAYLKFSEIKYKNRKLKEAIFYLKKAMYLLNDKYIKKHNEEIKLQIKNIYIKLACICALSHSILKSIAYINGAYNIGEIKNEDFLNNKCFSGLREIVNEVNFQIQRKSNIEANKKLEVKYFSYLKKFNPVELKNEIKKEHVKKVLSKNELFELYEIDTLNGIIYKVYYNEKKLPLKMDVLSLIQHKPVVFKKFQEFYFDDLGRVKIITSKHYARVGWGVCSNFFYKNNTMYIKKIIRKIKFFPYYIEKILIENFR